MDGKWISELSESDVVLVAELRGMVLPAATNDRAKGSWASRYNTSSTEVTDPSSCFGGVTLANPTWMQFPMMADVDQDEVFESVVRLVAVDVVNLHLRWDGAKGVFPDQPMFKRVTTGDIGLYLNISVLT